MSRKCAGYKSLLVGSIIVAVMAACSSGPGKQKQSAIAVVVQSPEAPFNLSVNDAQIIPMHIGLLVPSVTPGLPPVFRTQLKNEQELVLDLPVGLVNGFAGVFSVAIPKDKTRQEFCSRKDNEGPNSPGPNQGGVSSGSGENNNNSANNQNERDAALLYSEVSFSEQISPTTDTLNIRFPAYREMPFIRMGFMVEESPGVPAAGAKLEYVYEFSGQVLKDPCDGANGIDDVVSPHGRVVTEMPDMNQTHLNIRVSYKGTTKDFKGVAGNASNPLQSVYVLRLNAADKNPIPFPPSGDFDGDGKSNQEEVDLGTSIFNSWNSNVNSNSQIVFPDQLQFEISNQCTLDVWANPNPTAAAGFVLDHAESSAKLSINQSSLSSQGYLDGFEVFNLAGILGSISSGIDVSWTIFANPGIQASRNYHFSFDLNGIPSWGSYLMPGDSETRDASGSPSALSLGSSLSLLNSRAEGNQIYPDGCLSSGCTAPRASISLGGSAGCVKKMNGGGASANCWGASESGVAGNANSTNNQILSSAVTLSGGEYPLQISVGGSSVSDGTTSFACAVTSTDLLAVSGHVQCWGDKVSGKVGDGYNTGTSSVGLLVQTTGTTQGANNFSNVVQVSSGGAHACALTSAGAVSCWGSNSSGQLGDSTFVDKSNPVIAVSSGAVSVAAGENHSCALMAGSDVKCWGINGDGQLGDGTNGNSNSAVTVSGLNSVVGIYAGDTHTCAILMGGKVKCWGDNSFGQLGDGTMTDRTTPQYVLNSSASHLEDVVSLALGAFHTCALIDNGEVFCWGKNTVGQSGVNYTTGSNSATIPAHNDGSCNAASCVPSQGLTVKAKALTAGGDTTCVLTLTNEVKCWGEGTVGQIANNSLADVTVPTLSVFAGGGSAVVQECRVLGVTNWFGMPN